MKLLRDQYYLLKPYLPRRLRMAARRFLARRKLARCGGVWPIKPGTEKPPPGWPGWPEGKKFAVVLSHDVEGQTGLDRVKQLAELEMKLGFRSSFNFIPEGDYKVSKELRDWLTDNGFEVGVHDLYHDGKLYASKEAFQEHARKINYYVKEWKVAGFRSGFMHHNLDWIHDLNIQYDASTFDTDPFEPQPDGADTIFPFWVPSPRPSDGRGIKGEGDLTTKNTKNTESNREIREIREKGDGGQNVQHSTFNVQHSTPNSEHSTFSFQPSALPPRGYVELPYTLPQDSTLFLILRERNIGTWKRKLDWIAEHGGMALLNVHPDYLSFDGSAPNGRDFPSTFYQDFLQHVAQKFKGQYWLANPTQVAGWYNTNCLPAPTDAGAAAICKPSFLPPASRRRVLMFVENNYPQDTRVKNEAELLTQAGYQVVMVALRKKSQPPSEVINGVQVYRIPRYELFDKTPRENPTLAQKIWLKAKSLVGYVWEYVYFTSACFITSLYVAFKHGFDIIHANNPPDTLFMVALPYKLLGKKFIFDHHDLCPELYRSRYRTGVDMLSRMLQVVEWCSLKLANVTIATNESYKEAHIQRAGKDPKTIFVVRNGPNAQRMVVHPPSARLRNMGKCILCYIGALNPQDGVDYLMRSLGILVHKLQRRDFYCVIMGSGDSLEDLRAQAKELQLEDYVELPGFVSDADLQANLSAADICVDPDPSSPLNDVSTWIKIMEYMAYGKPIVSFDLKETRFSAQDAALFVPPNDELAFAKAIARLMDDKDLRDKMGRFGRERVEKHLQWSIVGQNLIAAYASLQ